MRKLLILMFSLLCLYNIIVNGFHLSHIPLVNTEISGYIVNGNDADITEFPYQILILYHGQTHCGGSIISEKIILTAAHCLAIIRDLENLMIRAGTSDSTKDGIDRKVTQKIVHEKWNEKTIENDIGLLILDKPLAFSDKIQPINLPDKLEQFKIGTHVFVSGWGLTAKSNKNHPNILQYTELEIFDTTQCNATYGNMIPKNVVCATGNGPDSGDICSGDSGGPLVIHQNEATPKVIGIVSFGACKPEYPSVYTNVSNYIDWIFENTLEYLIK